MVKQMTVQVIDDLDGAVIDDGNETISWALDGRAYEFDTSPLHAAEFREVLAPYEKISRTVASFSRPGTKVRDTRVRTRTQEVRDWARTNGHDISSRGRIPTAVHDAFAAAQR